MPFTPLGIAMEKKMAAQSVLGQQVLATQAVDAATLVFSSLFPSEMAALAKPLFLKNRTLTITCSSAAIAQEIRLRQTDIVAQINEKVGMQVVDRIRYLS